MIVENEIEPRRPRILWLGDPGGDDVGLVGGKVANLSRLAARHPVPPGFCLTTEAFSHARCVAPDRPAPRLAGGLRRMLEAAYLAMALRLGRETPRVAVRSSGVDEDGRLASFAGQHETFLNVSGFEAVAAAVQDCWASLQTERALEYRRYHGLTVDGVRLAVLVQHLVAADVAAIAFSANPIDGDRDEIVVTANWGLGESLVGGTVTPDTYRLRKDDLTLTERRIGEKRRMTIAVPGGTREVDVPRLLRERPCLDDSQAVQIGRLARDLEATMGWPVDVECAIEAGQLYLLQCRQITTLGQNVKTVKTSKENERDPG